MQNNPAIYTDTMTDEELQFLIRKDEKETVLFYRVVRVLMVICFVIPFIVAWVRAAKGDEKPFEYGYYFLGVLFLMTFLGVVLFAAYKNVMEKLKLDIKRKIKIVERTKIVRKQFVRQNNTFFFYLDSPNKLSIEVAERDYRMFNDGDELNIEYSKYSKFYFGYF